MIFIERVLQGHHDFTKYAFRFSEKLFKTSRKKNKILLPDYNFMSTKVEFAMRIEALVILFCLRQSLLRGARIHD
jgi:hypothetical protein